MLGLKKTLTPSGPRFFSVPFEPRFGGGDELKNLYAHVLPLKFFEKKIVLRLLGLKKGLKIWPCLKMSKPNSSYMNIFKNSFRTEFHASFLPSSDTHHFISMWKKSFIGVFTERVDIYNIYSLWVSATKSWEKSRFHILDISVGQKTVLTGLKDDLSKKSSILNFKKCRYELPLPYLPYFDTKPICEEKNPFIQY